MRIEKPLLTQVINDTFLYNLSSIILNKIHKSKFPIIETNYKTNKRFKLSVRFISQLIL